MNTKHLCKRLIVLTTLYATICMLHWPIGFTFFTQLSNLFAAAAAGAQLIAERKRGSSGLRSVLHSVKFTAVLSVTVTFLVFLTALAPLHPDGMAAAYLQDHGASLCMHLINPALMTVDFYLWDARLPYSRKHVALGLLPPFFYLLFILTLGGCGVRWYGSMAAPYPFLNYLAPAGWFGFRPDSIGRTSLGLGVFYCIIILFLVFAGLGWVQWRLAGVRRRKTPPGTGSLAQKWATGTGSLAQK